MERTLPAASLLALVLLLPAAPPARAQQGIQVNTSPGTGVDIPGDAGNEPSLAISPADPSVIVVGWRNFATIASDERKAGYGYSNDGGLTFTAGGTLSPPPGWPASTNQTDPVLTSDTAGTIFYWSEPFRPSFAEYVYRSITDGMSWLAAVPVDGAIDGDKPWIAVDTTGSIGNGHLYGGWNDFTLGGMCFSRSTNGGASYSAAVRIADRTDEQWMLHFAVGPDGELYAAWRNYGTNRIYVTKSLNARDASVTPNFNGFGSGGTNGLDRTLDTSNDPGFLAVNPIGFHQIYLGVDGSDSPRRGWVYCCWADARRDICDIAFARSTDGGFNWTTGIRVNDDPAGDYQWMPAMSVAPDGRIDVVWYDGRNSTGGGVPKSQVFYAFSLDGGATWSVNKRLSDAFDTTVGWPSQEKIGDYIDAKSDDVSVAFVYSATYKGGQDVYFMRARPILLRARRGLDAASLVVEVSGADPARRVHLAWSGSGPGTTEVPRLQARLGLDDARRAAPPKRPDAEGRAEWTISLPEWREGQEVWLQAIQLEGGSNPIVERL